MDRQRKLRFFGFLMVDSVMDGAGQWSTSEGVKDISSFDEIDRTYGCIYADIPWNHKGNSVARPGRNARRHYKTVSLEDAKSLPVKKVIDTDCALFFWVPGQFLVIGAHIPIMKSWGFRPTAMGLRWVKLNPKAPKMFMTIDDFHRGLGLTTMKNIEDCVLGKRGKSMRVKAVSELIIANRREHSRKPEEARERIREYIGPDVRVLELFGRSRPENDDLWDTWGDQVQLF
ncbi:MT-A70 family methyltransferase [Roseibium sp. Sym1]|uniref:MT-A70 family methyltransferase n=1 Tax=Roseibium sp. Sym1 TaxID=3016006 RepID=UPI0022B50CB4|nr:MT-A70 family methyltransferase [Roseibium sp. Sym1]